MAFGTVIFPQYTLSVFYSCFVNHHQLIGLTTTATHHARQQSEGRHHITDPGANLCGVFGCNNIDWLSPKLRCLKTLSKGASLALRPPHNCRGHLPKRLVMMRLLVISVHVYYLASASLRLAHWSFSVFYPAMGMGSFSNPFGAVRAGFTCSVALTIGGHPLLFV